jgi:hypothetical protein
VEFILEDFEKIIDNSTGNSADSEYFEKIKDNCPDSLTGTSSLLYIILEDFEKIILNTSR